ncbi:MAG: hypothetical protein DRQ47_05705 [Gammaproteobacteria bacterium]|nr:MAG: hypothetical protein DRQ47_05705 [Gammaproteobacteria bacterium]
MKDEKNLNDHKEKLLSDNESKTRTTLNDGVTNVSDQEKKKKILVTVIIGVLAVGFVFIMFGGSSDKKESKSQNTNMVGSGADASQIQADLMAKLKKMGVVKERIIREQAQAAGRSEMQAKTAAQAQQHQMMAKAETQQTKALMNAPLGMTFADVSVPHKKAEGNQATTSGMVGKSGYAQFANSQPSSVSSEEASWLEHPNYTIVQGEFMHAVLDTAISSEIQGSARATVTRPVYAYGDQSVLIPVGSRLVGQYAMSNQGGNGVASTRVFVIWNRVITPNGISLMINSGSADSLGVAGQKADYVDTHFFKMFGTSIMLSLIGAGASNVNSGADGANAQQQYQAAIQQSLAQTSGSVLEKYTNIAATLYVNQGAEINVYIAKDLDLYKAMHRQS